MRIVELEPHIVERKKYEILIELEELVTYSEAHTYAWPFVLPAAPFSHNSTLTRHLEGLRSLGGDSLSQANSTRAPFSARIAVSYAVDHLSELFRRPRRF